LAEAIKIIARQVKIAQVPARPAAGSQGRRPASALEPAIIPAARAGPLQDEHGKIPAFRG
jgi:hypothetical protein